MPKVPSFGISERMKVAFDSKKTDMIKQMHGFVFVHEKKTLIFQSRYLLFNG